MLTATVTFETAKTILVKGLKQGINYIDTSPRYGQGKSEETIGRALEGVPRSAYYLATKVGKYGMTEFDFSADKVSNTVLQMGSIMSMIAPKLLHHASLIYFCPFLLVSKSSYYFIGQEVLQGESGEAKGGLCRPYSGILLCFDLY